MSDYLRIEKAMTYISEHVTQQPSLEQVASHVHLSPFHFQRLFCRWCGTTPKRFLQALTLERSKRLLATDTPLMTVAHSIGLSGGSRLYDHYVQLEAVTPGEFKSHGHNVVIEYGLHPSPLGTLFIAVTERGICRIEFADYNEAAEPLLALQKQWPLATVTRNDSATVYVKDALFDSGAKPYHGPLSLYVSGTNFQVAVWRALLAIPPGRLASYAQIAAVLGRPKSARAVGNAVGANPVALMIPCHRVIQRSGALGGYRWGVVKKQMVQLWEFSHAEEVANPDR